MISSTHRAHALLCGALLFLLLSSPLHAQPRPVEVALHLHCFSGVAEGERARLDYWSKGLARGNPDPDCVARQPLLAPVRLHAVSHKHDPESTVELIRLEIDPARQTEVSQVLLANQRKVIAVTVQNRIVAVVFVAGATTDNRIPVYIADKPAAADLVSDLGILLGSTRR